MHFTAVNGYNLYKRDFLLCSNYSVYATLPGACIVVRYFQDSAIFVSDLFCAASSQMT
jgi:hypothetical protein